MLPLLVVVSVKDRECFNEHLFKCLPNIGVEYQLIETDPNLPLSASMNSIAKHKELLENTKYILFIHQDVEFKTQDWGKKIIYWCNRLPDLGYAGIECVTRTTPPDWIDCDDGTWITEPTICETCDSNFAVIPAWLFLERQFDESFPWYPVMEDYACWVAFVKNLGVYALPNESETQMQPLKVENAVGFEHTGCSSEYKVRSITTERGFPTGHDYRVWLKGEWMRLNQKWAKYLGLERISLNTTTDGNRRNWDTSFNIWSPWRKPIVVVCSITNQECYEKLLARNLLHFGVPYTLILTDPTLNLPQSYNTIVKTHRKELEESQYVVFACQDNSFEPNYGKKLVEVCNSLGLDFGFGASQGITDIGDVKTQPSTPIKVQTCDSAGMVIIPSKLFLEHQFDESYEWYPFIEDYACWIQYERGLGVYALPLGVYASDGCQRTELNFITKILKTNTGRDESRVYAIKEHLRMEQKWGRKIYTLTSVVCLGDRSTWKSQMGDE